MSGLLLTATAIAALADLLSVYERVGISPTYGLATQLAVPMLANLGPQHLGYSKILFQTQIRPVFWPGTKTCQADRLVSTLL
jgi:hypothetical protein